MLGNKAMGNQNFHSAVLLVSVSLFAGSAVINPGTTGLSLAAQGSGSESLQFRSTSQAVGARPTYFFTLKNPRQASAIKAVRIVQTENLETVQFQGDSVKAFTGLEPKRNNNRSLTPIGGLAQAGAVTVAFAKPVQPGETVTIMVKPQQNPSIGGIYRFGVIAFAQPSDFTGRFLGFGQLNISAEKEI